MGSGVYFRVYIRVYLRVYKPLIPGIPQGCTPLIPGYSSWLIFPFHCWLIIRRPCSSVLSVAGFLVFPLLFPFHCWLVLSSPFPFHCWTMLNTDLTVDVHPAHIQGITLTFRTFPDSRDVRMMPESYSQFVKNVHTLGIYSRETSFFLTQNKPRSCRKQAQNGQETRYRKQCCTRATLFSLSLFS